MASHQRLAVLQEWQGAWCRACCASEYDCAYPGSHMRGRVLVHGTALADDHCRASRFVSPSRIRPANGHQPTIESRGTGMAINRLLAPLHLLQNPVAAGRNVGRPATRRGQFTVSRVSSKQENIRVCSLQTTCGETIPSKLSARKSPKALARWLPQRWPERKDWFRRARPVSRMNEESRRSILGFERIPRRSAAPPAAPVANRRSQGGRVTEGWLHQRFRFTFRPFPPAWPVQVRSGACSPISAKTVSALSSTF